MGNPWYQGAKVSWTKGGPSSDCPVGWHTDDAPWRGQVRDPSSLERLGSRPVLAQNQGVSPRASRRGFFRPRKGVPRFFGTENRPVFFFENLGIACPHSRRVFFRPPKTRPWVFRRLKRPVSIENLGIACGHSRRVFFRAQKHAPGFFGGQKRPISSSRNSPTSPRWSPY